MKKKIVLCCVLLTAPVYAGQLFEWKDPNTGKLMLGDKPPTDGTQYWPEGARPRPKAPETVVKPIAPTKTPEQEEAERAARWAEMDRKRQERNEAAELMSRPATDITTPAAQNEKFDIAAHCKHIASIPKGGSYTIEQTCREQEYQAQTKLQAMTIPPEIMEHCAHIGSMPIGGSYTIMLTCVEQEMKAKTNLR